MAGSFNQCTLIGNLGVDPDCRRTQDGKLIVNLSVATTDSWKDRSTGERREKTEWHRVVVFSEGLAKVAENYLRKGSKVMLQGQLQTRKWQDQQGQDKYTTEIVLQGFNASLVMLDGRTEASQAGNSDNYSQSQPDIDETARKADQALDGDIVNSGAGYRDDMDDEIPFNMEWRG